MNGALEPRFDTMSPVDDAGYAFFQRKVLRLTGIDLSAYKSQQMRRRLGTLLSRNRVTNVLEYSKLLDQPAKLQEFLDFFTINVSEFFRIPEKFQYLEKQVLPELLRRGGREVRVWSAGCSNGAEPYSMAMILDEIAPLGRWSVLATDVDRTTLARAQRGDKYTPADLRNVGDRRLAKYFEPETAGSYRVKDSLKKRVHFKVHDLLRDPFESGFQLILCRHVVIYFTEEAKDTLYKKFSDSLEEGGVLFVGGTEIIPRARDVGFEPMSVSFYRKVSH
jgi:chemotaxis protein methyltransferase CheR